MRTRLAILVLFALTLKVAQAAPQVLFRNFRIHTVATQDRVGLKVLELLGPQAKPMQTARPIVLMHGFTSNWNSWHLIADAYRSAGLRVFIVNWRGHGQGEHQSRVLGEPYNSYDQRYDFHHLAVYDVPAVVNFAYQLSGGKKVIYQSHSMGGMMANLAFAGVTADAHGNVIVSSAAGKRYESKVAAYIPIAAPNSLRFKEFPGANLMANSLGIFGINGDRSDDLELPFSRSRATALYWATRANPLAWGLVNAKFMSVEEFALMSKYAASDVPRAISDNMLEMRNGFFGTEDRRVNYETISQARGTEPFHRTQIPILMISAMTDVLAQLPQQDALASRRGCRHVRIPELGHVDIVLGSIGARRVIAETLAFLEIAN